MNAFKRLASGALALVLTFSIFPVPVLGGSVLTCTETEGELHTHTEVCYQEVFSVSVDTRGGSEVAAGWGSSLQPGQTITLPAAPAREHFSFLSWNTAADGSGTTYAPGSSYTVTGDAVVYALWQRVSYPVRYENISGADTSGLPAVHSCGGWTAIPDLSSSAGEFLGWKVNGSDTVTKNLVLQGDYTSDTITLTAQWRRPLRSADLSAFANPEAGAPLVESYSGDGYIATAQWISGTAALYAARASTRATVKYECGETYFAKVTVEAQDGYFIDPELCVPGWNREDSSGEDSATFTREATVPGKHQYVPDWDWSADCKHATYNELCKVCDYLGMSKAAQVSGPVVTVAAQCLTAGKETYTATCISSQSAEVSNEKELDIPAPGHKFSTWSVPVAPTLTSDGQKVHECKACEQEETKVIPRLSENRAEDADGPDAGQIVCTSEKPDRILPSFEIQNSTSSLRSLMCGNAEFEQEYANGKTIDFSVSVSQMSGVSQSVKTQIKQDYPQSNQDNICMDVKLLMKAAGKTTQTLDNPVRDLKLHMVVPSGVKVDGREFRLYHVDANGTIERVFNSADNTDFNFSVAHFSTFVMAIHDHEYTEWTVTKYPTQTDDGAKQRTCRETDCGNADTQIIMKLSAEKDRNEKNAVELIRSVPQGDLPGATAKSASQLREVLYGKDFPHVGKEDLQNKKNTNADNEYAIANGSKLTYKILSTQIADSNTKTTVQALTKEKYPAAESIVTMDISILRTVDGQNYGVENIADQPIQMELTIPENMRKSGRVFKLFHYDANQTDAKKKFVEVETKLSGNTLSFETNGFSPFSLAYHDHTWGKGVVIKQPTTNKTGIKRYTCTKCSATKDEVLAAGVATGDISHIEMWNGLFAAALICGTAVMMIPDKKKNRNR